MNGEGDRKKKKNLIKIVSVFQLLEKKGGGGMKLSFCKLRKKKKKTEIVRLHKAAE